MSLTTHVYQRRRAQGYVFATDVPSTPETAGKRCKKCAHFANVFRARCSLGDFHVTKNATCDQWRSA